LFALLKNVAKVDFGLYRFYRCWKIKKRVSELEHHAKGIEERFVLGQGLLHDPLMLALPKAFAPPSTLHDIFISTLAKASFRRYEMKMPLQLRWKGICNLY
jgi:hypothetical protein